MLLQLRRQRRRLAATPPLHGRHRHFGGAGRGAQLRLGCCQLRFQPLGSLRLLRQRMLKVAADIPKLRTLLA